MGRVQEEESILSHGFYPGQHRELSGAQTAQRLGPGEHIGELTAPTGRARPTDAVAVGPVRALAISGGAFGNLILDRPEVARLMLAALAVRLSDALGDDGAWP